MTLVQSFPSKIQHITCDIRKGTRDSQELQLKLTFEDKMDRELISELKEGKFEGEKVSLNFFTFVLIHLLFYTVGLSLNQFTLVDLIPGDEPNSLAQDLVENGLANEVRLTYLQISTIILHAFLFALQHDIGLLARHIAKKLTEPLQSVH